MSVDNNVLGTYLHGLFRRTGDALTLAAVGRAGRGRSLRLPAVSRGADRTPGRRGGKRCMPLEMLLELMSMEPRPMSIALLIALALALDFLLGEPPTLPSAGGVRAPGRCRRSAPQLERRRAQRTGSFGWCLAVVPLVLLAWAIDAWLQSSAALYLLWSACHPVPGDWLEQP